LDEDPVNDENGDGNVDQKDQGSVSNGEDADYDQLVRPRGAAFIELYNPWPANPGANADTHTLPSAGTDLGVNLSAFNTDPTNPTKKSPVWRLMIYKDGGPKKDPDDPVPANRPQKPDRSVYFTTNAQVAGTDLGNLDPKDGTAYYAGLPVTSVRPGRYMVVGSGEETAAGSGIYESPIGDIDPNAATLPARNRAVVLNTNNVSNTVRLMDEDGNPVMDAAGFPVEAPEERNQENDPNRVLPVIQNNPKQSVADVAIINQVATGKRRFTLTEPAAGYPANVGASSWSESAGIYADARDVRANNPASTPKPIDIPLDDQRTDGETRLRLRDKNDRTIPAFSWIYLQRLANPLLPYDKVTNPYLTVDSMGANVTVFNGCWT